jgi:hypothetical protein
MSTIDTEMREAYRRWEKACDCYNLELTPAYDLTALTAIVNPNSGTITKTENVDGIKIDTWKMSPEKVKDPKEILEFQTYVTDAATGNSLPSNLIILTDYGEEADDEITCFMANLLKKVGVKVTIIHTVMNDNAEFNKQNKLYKDRGGLNPFISIDAITNRHFNTYLSDVPAKNVILQIGPIRDWKHTDVDFGKLKQTISQFKGRYKYYIEGTIGNTFNSKGDAERIPQDFIDNSTTTVVCDAARGEGAYKWVMTHVREAVENAGASPDAADSLCDRVMKIGWRNTVGRAGTAYAKFIAGLVAPGGANYKVVEGIVEKMTRMGKEGVKFELTDEKIQEANQLATLYFDNLTSKNNIVPLVLNSDEKTTNSVHKATKENIIDGYVYILTNLYKYFGVPIKFFLSGVPGNWEKYWETPSNKDLKDRKVNYQFEEGKLQHAKTKPSLNRQDMDGGRKLKKKTLKKKSNLKHGKKHKNNSKKRKNNKSNKKQKRNNKKSNKRN